METVLPRLGHRGRYSANANDVAKVEFLSNPFQSPAESNDELPADRLGNSTGKMGLVIWSVGYGAQILLYSLFLASMNTKFAITEFEYRDAIFVTFNSFIVFCSLISLFAIARYQLHHGIGKCIAMSVGSIALFGATYFGFFMICVSIAFSGM